jgi:hypothetical protein
MPSSVTFASDLVVARTNLKCDASNTKDSLRNWVQLAGVNSLLVLCGCGRTDLCEGSAIFHRPVHGLLYRSTHQWAVFVKQSFEFMERRA